MANANQRRLVLGRTSRMAMFAVLAVAAIGFVAREVGSRIAAARNEREAVGALVASETALRGRERFVRVALFDDGLGDESATEGLKRILDAKPQFAWKRVSPDEIRQGRLANFDVAIFPGGSSPAQAEVLRDDGKQAVRRFVRDGGGYVGICAGAFLATSGYDWSLAIVDADALTGEIEVPGKGTVSMAARNAGIVRSCLTAAGMKTFSDQPTSFAILYSGGPILSPGNGTGLPPYVTLAVYQTEVFDSDDQKGTMVDTPAITASQFGRGRVVLFSPHPDMTPGREQFVRSAILAAARQR